MIRLGEVRLVQDEKFPHMVRVESPTEETATISIRELVGALIAMGSGWENLDPLTGYMEKGKARTRATDFLHDDLYEGLAHGGELCKK